MWLARPASRIPSASVAATTSSDSWRAWPPLIRFPVLDPLHRPVADDHGRDDDGDLLADREGLLAERPAHIAHDNVDIALRHTQGAGVKQAGQLHALAGQDDVQALGGGVPLGDQAPGLHRHAHVAVLVERLVEHVRGAGQQLGQAVRLGFGQRGGHVAGQLLVHPRASLGQRLLGGNHGLGRLDVHRDQLGGVLGQVAGLSQHHGDGVTDVPHVDVGQEPPRGLVPGGRRHAGPVVDVSGGQHGDHARRLAGFGDVQARDPAAGHLAAHERDVHRAGLVQVVDVAAVPGDHPLVFQARQPLADEPGRGGAGHAVRGVVMGRFGADGWLPSEVTADSAPSEDNRRAGFRPSWPCAWAVGRAGLNFYNVSSIKCRRGCVAPSAAAERGSAAPQASRGAGDAARG
jgi:hypothetical protein